MTISVAIKPELEARLAARARTSGQSLEGLIEGIFEQEATAFAGLASHQVVAHSHGTTSKTYRFGAFAAAESAGGDSPEGSGSVLMSWNGRCAASRRM